MFFPPQIEDTIGFTRIRERLLSFCFSPVTREWVEKLSPFSTIEQVERALQEVQEFAEMDQFDGLPRFRNFPDIRPQFQILRISGSFIQTKGWLDLLSVLDLACENKELAQERNIFPKYPFLNPYFQKLGSWGPVKKRIEKVVSPEGLVQDMASQKLQQIRRQIRRLREDILDAIQALLDSSRVAPLLQERNFTIRRGRYVIPVKASHSHLVKGIAIDYSSSGSTVFVEPEKVFQLNNQLDRLKLAEEEEIRRILLELTDFVRPLTDELEQAFYTLVGLDFLQAKNKVARAIGGQFPQIGGEKLTIIQGRHPLLGERAVPFSLEVNPENPVLVVSGPNAGGKTVLLKSVALILYLTYCGILPPLKAGSSIPFYQGIFVDIGDHQDLENNLSTFTFKMTLLKQAFASNRELKGTLFLLDEIGAGTDPDEGSALGMAILSYLRDQGATCLATTHLPGIKFGLDNQPGMVSASLEVDPISLQPTYQLSLGKVGVSLGVEIAKRVGLPAKIIEEAQENLSRERWDLNRLLLSYTQKSQELDRLLQDYQVRQQNLEREKAELERLKLELTREKRKFQQKLHRELTEYLEDLKIEIADKVGKLRKEKTLDEEVYQTLRSAIKKEERELARIDLENEGNSNFPSFQIGEEVTIFHLQQSGRIIALDLKKKEATIQAPQGRVRAPLSSLRKKSPAEQTEAEQAVRNHSFSSVVRVRSKSRVTPEIEIRRLNKEEALGKLEKYLDQAVLAGFQKVYIIHGKGEGILRKATHEFLQEHPQVDSFRLGDAAEGGAGVTVVTLK